MTLKLLDLNLSLLQAHPLLFIYALGFAAMAVYVRVLDSLELQ